MANRKTGFVRRRRDIFVIFITLCASYFFIARALDQSSALPSTGAFAILCALISVKHRAISAAFVPVIFIPTALFTLATAAIAVALLSAGQWVVQLAFFLIEGAVESWKKHRSNKIAGKNENSEIAKVAYIKIATGPVRGVILTVLFIASLSGPGILWSLALIVPAIFFWKGSYKSCAAAALIVSALAGWEVIPLLFSALAFLLEVVRLTARPPRQRLMFPRPGRFLSPWPWLHTVICDKRLRRGDLIAARRALPRRRPENHFYQLRLVHLDLEERSYQSGLACVRLLDTATAQMRPFWQMCYGRALSGTAQFSVARRVYGELLAPDGCPSELFAAVSLLAAENDLAAGELDAARNRAEALWPRLSGREYYLDRLRACRILAEIALSADDKPGARRWLDQRRNEHFGNRWERRFATAGQGRAVRLVFGPRGSTYVQMIRFDILERRAAKAAGTGERDDFDLEVFAFAMSLASCWDDLVDLLLGEAEAAAAVGNHAEAAGLGARALMELDRTRYSLAAQSARTSWSRRFRRGVSVTLSAAHHQQDSRLQAELIEFSRVQTLPSANGEMVGALALATPPVVKVRGRVQLARPGIAGRPAAVEIENAAHRAAGPGASWLSFWEIDDWLYWSLIPPGTGPIQIGRESMAPGFALFETLAALHRCLPVLLPGEDLPAADFRMATSPLLADAAAEARLSSALGRILLPAALTKAAWRHRIETGERLALAIAPSASLGYVPWSLLAVYDQQAGGAVDPDRLLDLCDWVLAPSAALIMNAKPSAIHPAPLTIAVIDTCATDKLGSLPGAREQAQSLPPEVTVLGGRHWTSAIATLPELEVQLCRQREAFTAAFMCHAVRGTPDEPSAGGLVMAASVGENIAPATQRRDITVLSPSTIFEMATRHVPMPSQVLLEACDTSALSDAGSGEWLTVAPAFIIGGCREVITTQYPVPDQSGTSDALMQAALAGTSLCAALRDWQRQGLVRWMSGNVRNISDTPFAWAAYAPICIRDFDVGDRPIRRASYEMVSTRCIRVLAQAVKRCRELKGKRLHSGYVLSSYLEISDLADRFDGEDYRLRPSALLWNLGPYLLSRLPGFRDPLMESLESAGGLQLFVSSLLMEAIREAQDAAYGDGTLIEPEHIVRCLLNKSSGARRVLALVSRTARKPTTLIIRAIDHTLADEIAKPQASWARNVAADQEFVLAIIELALGRSMR